MSDLRRTKSRAVVVLFAMSGAGASASHTKLCSATLAASAAAAATTCSHDVSRRGVLHTATALASGIVPSAAHADGDEERQKYFLRFPTLFAPLYGESSRRTIKRQLGDRIWALEQQTSVGKGWPNGGRHLLSSPVRRSSRTSSSGRSRRLCAAWWSGYRMALCGSTRRSRRRGSSSSSSSRARRSAVPPALVPLALAPPP